MRVLLDLLPGHYPWPMAHSMQAQVVKYYCSTQTFALFDSSVHQS
jgi:hypothetical protein